VIFYWIILKKMATNLFCIADVTSDVSTRLNKAIEITGRRIGVTRLNQLRGLQAKIDDLKRRGLLKREEFTPANPADLRRIFAKRH
jgi:hypothetical protein